MKKFIASIGVLMACCLIGQASFAQNSITDWAGIVQSAILNPPRPPQVPRCFMPPFSLLCTTPRWPS